MSANNNRRTNFLGYDLFKLIVALILLIILILLLLRGCSGASGLASATEPATAAPTETSQPGETAANSSTESAATAPAGVAPAITAPKDGDQIEAGSITIAGISQPGAKLDILDSGKVAGQVTATDEGKWFFEGQIEPGQHIFVASMADGSLKSGPVSVTVRLKEATPTPPPISAHISPTAAPAVASGGAGCDGLISGYLKDKDHYVVGSCDTLSGIAVWLDVTVDSLLESNPQITDPDTIIPGDIVNVPPRQGQNIP